MDKRSPNFTTSEINFLLEAVKNYSEVIECKKTDKVGPEEKLKTWKNIESEFNSKFSQTFRSYKVLKTKYSNIKATAKQNFAFDKRQMYATGGGIQKPTATTNLDHKILEICQDSQILGKTSQYDCDKIENEFIDLEFLEQTLIEEDEDGVAEAKFDDVETKKEDRTVWDKYNPNKLKKPLNKALYKKEKPKTDVWGNDADAKLERQKLEIQFLKEKHELEVEKIQLEIAILKIKFEKLKCV